MLKICLVFWKSEPRYAYKLYAYKKNNMYVNCAKLVPSYVNSIGLINLTTMENLLIKLTDYSYRFILLLYERLYWLFLHRSSHCQGTRKSTRG